MTNGATIFALASGPAPAGIAVIRISGPQAGQALDFVLPSGGRPPPRRAALRRLVDPADGTDLDTALVLWLPGPSSFTGEDMAELQCHGGAATIAAIERCLSTLPCEPALRPAARGDFSRRAFANGRMDLTEVEGLADLVSAETEAQRRLALHHAAGGGRARYDAWTARLVHVLAMLEAAVDFPEDDLPDSITDRNEIEIRALLHEWKQHLEIGAAADRIRDGVRIAIIGAPNAGKSSLLNALAGREAAIVSEIAGTTRDVIEVRLDLGGYMATVSDTAGLRDSADAIEAEGVRRALGVAVSADLVLWLAEDPRTFAQPVAELQDRDPQDIVEVITKTDKIEVPIPDRSLSGSDRFAISALEGDGIGELLGALSRLCANRWGIAAEMVAVRDRHRDALARAAEALHRALDHREAALAGEEVRLAVSEIGRITGRVDVEAVLDVVFGELCIGK